MAEPIIFDFTVRHADREDVLVHHSVVDGVIIDVFQVEGVVRKHCSTTTHYDYRIVVVPEEPGILGATAAFTYFNRCGDFRTVESVLTGVGDGFESLVRLRCINVGTRVEVVLNFSFAQ